MIDEADDVGQTHFAATNGVPQLSPIVDGPRPLVRVLVAASHDVDLATDGRMAARRRVATAIFLAMFPKSR